LTSNANTSACLSSGEFEVVPVEEVRAIIVSTNYSHFLKSSLLRAISANLIKMGQILLVRRSNVVIVYAAASKQLRAKSKFSNL